MTPPAINASPPQYPAPSLTAQSLGGCLSAQSSRFPLTEIAAVVPCRHPLSSFPIPKLTDHYARCPPSQQFSLSADSVATCASTNSQLLVTNVRMTKANIHLSLCAGRIGSPIRDQKV